MTVVSLFLALSSLTTSAQAYDVVLHKYSVDGERAKALYQAVYDDEESREKPSEGLVGFEGLNCKTGPASCVTYTHDGDAKELTNGVKVYAALADVGFDFTQEGSNIVLCYRNDVASEKSGQRYTCKLQQELTKK